MVHRGSDEKWISNRGFTGVGNLFVCAVQDGKNTIHGTTRRELDAVKKKKKEEEEEEGGEPNQETKCLAKGHTGCTRYRSPTRTTSGYKNQLARSPQWHTAPRLPSTGTTS